MRFDAVIVGETIEITLAVDEDMPGPTLCFSLMIPAKVIEGGTMVRQVAGYSEVALPDLAAGQEAHLVIAHEWPEKPPANRAWLPLSPYLRAKDGRCVPLPQTDQGVRVTPMPATALPDGLRIVPPPQSWSPESGSLEAMSVQADHPALRAADDLARRCNLGPLIAPDGVPLTLETDAQIAPEGYRLSIASDGLTLAASDDAGRLYGAVTLLTLMRTHAGGLPCGIVTDSPRFEWRGQHLDCARHFFEVDSILRLLDLMALLKLNRFHWHFADDEAFRLQTQTAPALWQKSEMRGEGHVIPGVFGGGIEAGGSYGPDDVARILAHAKALHIEVLPEIEVPAHSHVLNAILPGLRDPGDNSAELCVQGYVGNAVNPAMPATWDLLEPLTSEVAAMFPLGILHLGCDELAPGTWDRSPAARALKDREALDTRDDLQGWMMHKLAAHLAEQGIRAAVWEEGVRGAQGGIGHAALVFSWTGQTPGFEAARMGHDVVMCPAQHVYLDMAHTDDPGDWGANWAAFIALEDTINWDPIPPEAQDIAHRIVGVEGTYWGEFTTDDRQMDAMLAPRLLGVACKAWEEDRRTDGPRLRALASVYARLFDAMGWEMHGGA